MGWQGQNTQGRELDCPRGKGRVKQHAEYTQDPQERRVKNIVTKAIFQEIIENLPKMMENTDPETQKDS